MPEQKRNLKVHPPRVPMPERDPEERVKGFQEVPLGYTEEQAIAEASRCLDCKNPKCVTGCPVNINIPKFLRELRDGRIQDAADTLRATNSLPAVCGRVCPQEEQCESLCIEGIKHDPVAVGNLEKFVADWERMHKKVTTQTVVEPTGRKVAIAGAGPAGLTVAGDLAKLGHDVTIFEALHRPAGVLAYGIPEFRLPREIVKSEIEYIERLGVKFIYNVIIGVTITLNELFEEGYDTVFIGTGAGLPKMLNVPGENLVGVFSSNEFLTRINLLGADRFPDFDTPVLHAKHTVVVGGGNTAMDSARVAKRLNQAKVSLVYRRSEEELPARKEEVHHAKAEGIEMNLLCNPVEVLGDKEGRVTGIRCIRMQLGEPDASGRRKPVEIPGSEFEMECDAVIVAVGNSPNPIITKSTPDLEATKWGTIKVDEATNATSKPGVYAGGDIVSGAATVILAMGAGRKAAAAMHEYMMNLPPKKAQAS
ncbi:MAG: NADPH-dependent glutamate synthase [Calditrichaeota bacterium]|nr:NADPH-dependent glutamate synthase [Calditrichota bacterium]MCB9367601.1 NADPH-dependent glutamate synthase [Calditrichota bacterium]